MALSTNKPWKCEPDPTDYHKACLTCQRVSRKTLSGLPCLRYLITDASLYREQRAPYQLFSQRWQSMDLVDIDLWASDEIRKIEISPVFVNAPFELEVRRFVPFEGDMLQEKWTDENRNIKTHDIPPYAIASMEATAQAFQSYVDRNISTYLVGAIGNLDVLLWTTYTTAFQHSSEAAVSLRILLRNVQASTDWLDST